MRIPAVKTKAVILLMFVTTAFVTLLPAQEVPEKPAPTATEGGNQPTGSPKASDGAGGGSQPNSSALDYLFNRKPQEGSAAKEVMDANQAAKSKMIARDALGFGRIEDPLMRARFDKYLGLAEVSVEQLAAYDADMKKVQELLREGRTTEAWRQLYKLAEYEYIDAGVSRELANRIESIWNADKTTVKLDKTNDKIRQELELVNRNADKLSEDVDARDARQRTERNQGNKRQSATKNPDGEGSLEGNNSAPAPSNNSTQSAFGKLELTEEYLKSLELKAKVKMNELKAQKLFDQAKGDFAEYITTLYGSGRQRHVLIAADFWRKIFDQGDYPVSMAQQVNASLEMSREVQNTVDVFNHRLDDNEIAEATDRLQEAFMLSEVHPAVLGLPRDKKKKVEAFTRRLAKMQNMIEVRDFTSLETLLDEMKQVAPDFDTTKPKAVIQAVKLESQLRLGKAKMAAQQGDTKQAMEEFQAAAEAWPGNPDLKDKALTFFNSQDLQTQSLTEFDRLVSENNYRGIFDKQLMFAPAMKDDTKRQEQLKAALEKVKGAEIAIEKANLLRSNGDVFGAWETVEFAIKSLPNDNKLNALRGDLAGKGAEFVSAINKAQEAENKKELGYSLTWYAIAQRYYPASQIANQAIERLSKEIIDKASL